MLKDLRWLLAAAWPFAVLASWELIRTLETAKPQRWLSVGAATSAALLAAIYYALAPMTEDLRASFHFDASSAGIRATYLFRNLGPQSVIVKGVALWEIVSTEDFQDANDSLAMCDNIGSADIGAMAISRFMGPGAQVGPPYKLSAAYSPTSQTIDGMPWQPAKLLSIETGRTSLVSGEFAPQESHWKGHRTIVLCPIIQTININNQGGISVCPGISYNFTIGMYCETESADQYQILPYSGTPRCVRAATLPSQYYCRSGDFTDHLTLAPPSPAPPESQAETLRLWFPY
jgi:hypothetical protein